MPQTPFNGRLSETRKAPCPRRVPSVRFRRLESVGYLVRRNACRELNAVAWRIWRLCDGRTPVGDIVAQLAREFDIPATVDTEKECGEFLEGLTHQGFLVWE